MYNNRTILTTTLPTEHSVIESHFKRHPRVLPCVVLISAFNVLCNTFRPDPDVGLLMRLPRIFWEMCIGIIALSARCGEGSILLLLLSLMTGPTALIDIFVWGPIFGATASFQRCRGGYLRGPRVCVPDFLKGAGRIMAMAQSIFGGLFYLLTAVICWSEYWKVRTAKEARRRAMWHDYSFDH